MLVARSLVGVRQMKRPGEGTMSTPGESGPGGDSRQLPTVPQPNGGAFVVSEGERKVVTVLFADVVSSLSFSQQFDDEQFRDLLDSALRQMVQAVEEFGGSVVRVQGDGVLALFGAPKALEDHAVRACLAALRLRNAFANGLSSRPGPEKLQVRIGLHTGEAIIRSLSTGLSHEYDAVGKAVHIGARTEHIFQLGSGLWTVDVVPITRGLFEVKEVAGHSIRGTNETYKLFELVAKAPEHLTINRLATPFIDREAILAAFDQMLIEAAARPIVHRLEGEAGYGKTRLIFELARRAERADFRVLEAKGISHLSNVPYFSVRTLVLRLLRLEDQERPENLEALLQQALDRLEALTPMDRAALLDILGVVRRDPAWEALNPPERRARLSQASVTLWWSVMGRKACLLIIEDVHWMDEPSLEVLSRIVASDHSGPFLAIVTHRTTKQELPAEISGAPVSRVEPFNLEQTYSLIRLVSTDLSMPPVVLETIAKRSAGVPFYVCELVRDHFEKLSAVKLPLTSPEGSSVAVSERGHSNIPLAIEASILARIDRLPEAAVKTVHTAAVIGSSCDLDILEQASRAAHGDFESALQQLIEAGLIQRIEATEHGQIAFHHEIIRDVVLRTIVKSRRRNLHLAVLRAMEERWSRDALGARQVHSLAFHAEAAQQWSKALDYLIGACRQAVKNSSVEEAVRLYDRALEAISKVDGRDFRSQEVDLRLLVFPAYLTLGEIERMSETLGAAAALANALGDARRLAFATVQLATAQWMSGDHVAAAASAHSVLEHAEQTNNLPLQLSARFTLANALHGQGDLSRAIAIHKQSVESLERLGLEHQRLGWAGLPSVMSRAFLSWFLVEIGQFDEARKHIDRGCAVADAARQPYSQVLIHVGQGIHCVRRGYPEEALPSLEPAFRMCQDAGVHTMEAFVSGWLGTALVQLGRAGDALAVTENSYRRHTHVRGGKYTWFYLFKAIGEANAALGNTEAALVWIDKAIDVTQRANEILHYAQGLKCRAEVRLGLSISSEEAVDDIKQAKEIAERCGLVPLLAECDLILARASQQLGRDGDVLKYASAATRSFRALGLDRFIAQAERLNG